LTGECLAAQHFIRQARKNQTNPWRDMAMKAATIVGIALIILGVVAFAYQGITYTTQEKVIDLGPVQATVEKKETIPLTPLLGGLALVGGIVLLVAGART
jgi:hypothetical protein